MSRTWTVVLILLVSLAPAREADERVHDLAELQALADGEQWVELARHLRGVPAGERGDHWRALAEASAIGCLKAAETASPGASDAVTLATELLQELPELASSRPFMDRRGEVGLRAFEDCFEERDPALCDLSLSRFVDTDRQNPELAAGAARLVARHRQVRAAVTYFEIAAAVDRSLCADETLQKAVVSSFGVPPRTHVAASARRLAARVCWPELRDVLLDELGRDGASSFFYQNACGLLLEHGALTGIEAQRCEARQQ